MLANIIKLGSNHNGPNNIPEVDGRVHALKYYQGLKNFKPSNQGFDGILFV